MRSRNTTVEKLLTEKERLKPLFQYINDAGRFRDTFGNDSMKANDSGRANTLEFPSITFPLSSYKSCSYSLCSCGAISGIPRFGDIGLHLAFRSTSRVVHVRAVPRHRKEVQGWEGKKRIRARGRPSPMVKGKEEANEPYSKYRRVSFRNSLPSNDSNSPAEPERLRPPWGDMLYSLVSILDAGRGYRALFFAGMLREYVIF